LTRHELKEQLQHDQFTDAVSHIVSYATGHRQRVARLAIAGAIVLAIAGGLYWYFSYQRSVRQRDLQAAFAVLDAQVGPASDYAKTFPTQDAKTKASIKALSDVVAKDGGTREGFIAQYYLGTLKAQQGDNAGAEADLSKVSDSSSEVRPLAKIALGTLYMGENKSADARKLLQSMIDKPSDLVSKAQAQIILARLDATANPQQAKALLQSLQTPDQRPAVTRAVNEVQAQLAK